MKPETALSRIPDFGAASVDGRLSGGPASDSFIVTKAGQRFVLRIDGPVAKELSLDRVSEAEIATAMGVASVGAKVIFSDPGAGILVTAFIPGQAWTTADLRAAENLQRLARLLRRLHGATPIGKPFAIRSAVAHYAGLIGSADARQFADEADALLRRLNAEDTRRCLCHNDLVSTNVIDLGSLHLIDWEYAALGDPFFDLATVVQHHGLSDDETAKFVTAYLGTVSERDWQHLHRYCRLYDRVLILWLTALECRSAISSEQRELLAEAKRRAASGPLL